MHWQLWQPASVPSNSDEGVTGLMSVTADARGTGRARLTLHVTVRINGRPEGPRYEILAYERLLDDQQ